MKDSQIIEETLRYLSDELYNYAILIDGEWGCGKTYFIQHSLREQIEKKEKETDSPRKVKYVSLYGCKSIEDIQENIIWGFAEEAKDNLKNKIRASKRIEKVSNNILLSSRKIGDAILKKFASKTSIFDITSDWLAMKSYIFVFDDLERCNCPINEVFGFINGLVEHEGTKVILVANEREISENGAKTKKELQYLLALNDKIEWPKKEEGYLDRIRKQTDKMSLEVLEERRKILFPDKEVDKVYRKIREKLIGVTLHYRPDIKAIAKVIVEKSDIDSKLKETLLVHMDNFYFVMDRYSHHNLRTFQFFLSKICYLYQQFVGIGIEEDYQEEAISFLVQDCFMWAVQFKGNVPIPADSWGKAEYEVRKKSLAIKKYVEIGEFDKNKFKKDIVMYVENELKNKIQIDDPYNVLYHQYYFHTQSWCEERLEEVKQKLQKNKYPLFVYTKIIILLVGLIEIGFSDKYMDDIKAIMLSNISNIDVPVKLDDDDLFFMEDKNRQQKVKDIIDELNLAIIARDKQIKQKTIEDILGDERWINQLNEYTSSDDYKSTMDISIFVKASAEQWIQALKVSSVEDIDGFRHWLAEHYPRNVIKEGVKIDLPTIEQIMEGIEPEKENDLIKRVNLSWLREQLKAILELYKKD
ncbi:MAG: hypothetical protein HFG31_01785 [Eubacterium sp.]|nr:hypothetical protein [Eubacterium sp.]